MAVQALYRKWRPGTFDEVVGQEHVIRTLHNALVQNRVSHAYLLTGPRGTGKTTTARLLAKAVNCLAPDPADRPCNHCAPCQAVNESRLLDLIEIDAASNRGIDNIRELRDKIAFAPSEGRYKVYIIDEVHMLTSEAFNALLKTLEEPPAHAIFILATTEVHKVPATVLSRCQRFDFRRLTVDQIVDRLAEIAAGENRLVESAALQLIARQATGALRDAESLLDQLLSATVGEVTVAQARQVLGTAASQEVEALVDAWLRADLATGLEIINRAVDQGADPRQFARQMVDALRHLLLFKLGSPNLAEIPAEVVATFRAQAARCDHRRLVEAVKRFNEALNDTRGGWQPQLPLELAFIDSLLGADQVPTAVAAPVTTGLAPSRPSLAETRPALESRPAAPVQAGREAAGSAFQEPGVSQSAGRAPDRSGASEPDRAIRPATGTPSQAPVPAATTQAPVPGLPASAPAGAEQESSPATPAPGTSLAQPTSPAPQPIRSVEPASVAQPLSPLPAGSLWSVDLLRNRWREIRSAVRAQDKSTEALLPDATPIAVQGHLITIGFKYDFHRSMAEKPRSKASIIAGLSQVLGADVQVQFVVGLDASPPANPDPFANDPVIQYAVQQLGAVIRPVSEEG